MKKLFKLACLCLGLGLGSQVKAQTITSSVALQTLNVSGVLNAASTNIPPGSSVAYPWLPISGPGDGITGTPLNPTELRTFTISGLPTGSNAFTWSAQGDLRITSVANTLTVTVGNINALARVGPGGLLVNDRGQSKGRLSFSYSYMPRDSVSGDTCINVRRVRATVSIDLLKKFTYITAPVTASNTSVAVIVGSKCLLPNTDYTYSVDETMQDNPNAGVGIDSYTWDFSQVTGATFLYASSDNSSITFRTGATVPNSANLLCYFGRVNAPTAETNASLRAVSTFALLSGAGTPTVTLSGAASSGASPLSILPSNNFNTPSSCVNTVLAGAGALTFTVTQQPGATYQWTFGTYGAAANGWNTAVPQINLPFTVTGTTFTVANVFNQPGTVTLRVTSTCGSVTDFVYTINRKLTVASSGIITLSTNCTQQGTGVTATFLASGNGAANLNNVTWSSATNPSNWSFPGGAGTYTLTPNGATPVGVYSLTPNFNGCAAAVPYTVNVRPSAVTLSSPNPLCLARPSTNVPVTFLPTGTTQYTYAITGTGNSTAASTTNVVNVSRTGAALTGTLTATYTVAAGCATSIAAQNILLPALTPTVTAPSCVSFGTPSANAIFTITNYPGVGTYSLVFVSGTALTTSVGPFTPDGLGKITVPISATASGSGTYNMTHTVTGCGTSTASTNFVLDNVTNRPTLDVFPQGANRLLIPSEIYPNFSGTGNTNWRYFNCGASPQTTCSAGTLLTTNANNITGNPVTNVSGSWKLVPQAGTNNVYGAEDTNSVGCIYRVWTTVSLSGFGNARVAVGDDQHTKNFTLPSKIGKIYPNPNDGKFAILIEQAEDNGHAAIIDFSGREVAHFEVKKGMNEVSEAKLAAGNYSVIIWLDHKVYANNIIVK